LEDNHTLFNEHQRSTTFQGETDEIEKGMLSLEDRKSWMASVFQDWKEEAPSIAESFRKRQRKLAREPMIYHLNQFLQVLYLGNGETFRNDPAEWKVSAADLAVLPVNAVERLTFIFDQPDHYHSYIQLSELFSEWEKKCAFLLKQKTYRQDL
jgi:hypothetical protein